MQRWEACNRHPGAAPHGFYRTKDGYIAHMSLTNKMWHMLLSIIGREDPIGDARYDKLDNRKTLWLEVDTMIEEWSTQTTTDEALKILKENGLSFGKVRTIDEMYDDPHSQEHGIFQEVENSVAGRMRITSIPIKPICRSRDNPRVPSSHVLENLYSCLFVDPSSLLKIYDRIIDSS